jgi:hypothetical protein
MYCSQAAGWEHATIGAANQIRYNLQKADPDVYQQWNKVAIDVRTKVIPIFNDLVSPKLADLALPPALSKSIGDSIQWDLVHIGILWDFYPYTSGGFYSIIADLYIAGHLPCGWIGKYPDGVLVVY